MSENKISFSFGGVKPAAAAAPPPADGLSNMERLLAQAKAKAPSTSSKPPGLQSKPAKKPIASLFAEDDDDDAPSSSKPNLLAGPSKPRHTPKPAASMSRAEKKLHDEALKIDANVFDYDSMYDGMKAAERRQEEAKKAEDAEGKPKYIEAFLQSAQTRKLDRLRAEEKMLQLEREKEGDEFADKDKFVTEAYKRQMAEVRKAEEEEKAREEALRKSKKGPGLTSFYKNMLDSEEQRHAAAVAAASGQTDSGPSLAIRPPPKDDFEDEAEYDPLLAQEERQRGGTNGSTTAAGTSKVLDDSGNEVEVNDEGEVVDKRTLLKAGLNIMKKPTAALPNSLLSGQRSSTTTDGPYKSRAVGTAASYQERMERERKRLADQVREEAERKRLAEESRRKEEEEAARRRREGDDGEAQRKREEARQRYLQRKRGGGDDTKGDAKKAKAD